MHIFDFAKIISLPEIIRVVIAVAISVFVLIVAASISYFLIRLLFNHYRKSLTVQRWLVLENQGNTNTFFQMKVDPRRERLKFKLLHQDAPLPNVEYLVKSAPEPERVQKTEKKPVVQKSTEPQPQKKDKKQSAGYAKAKKQSKAIVGVGRQIGGLLGSLGGFIPGSIGNDLKEKALLLQNTTQNANAAIEMPDIKKREAENIKNQMSGLTKTGKNSPKSDQQTAAAKATQNNSEIPQAESQPASETTLALKDGNAKTFPAKVRMVKSEFSKTPIVKPGESIKLKLKIDPVSIYRTKTFEYDIICQQYTEAEKNTAEMVNSTQKSDQIEINGKPMAYAFLNFVCSLAIVSLNGLWVILALKWLFRILFVG